MNAKTIDIYLYWFSKYSEYIKEYGFDEWIDYAKETYSTSTQKVIAASMQYYLKKNFKPSGYGHRNVIHTITEADYEFLIENIIAENSYVSSRQRLMLKIMWNTGIRISELLNLKWEDVSHRFLFIKGKGGKIRTIPYHETLFNESIKDGEYVISSNGTKMSYSNAYREFKEFGNIIGYKWLSPHTIRHSFATRLISKNLPIEYLSKLMGHSSLNTTMIYIHFKEESIKEFLNKI